MDIGNGPQEHFLNQVVGTIDIAGEQYWDGMPIRRRRHHGVAPIVRHAHASAVSAVTESARDFVHAAF
jgi:hypothetical protein